MNSRKISLEDIASNLFYYFFLQFIYIYRLWKAYAADSNIIKRCLKVNFTASTTCTCLNII